MAFSFKKYLHSLLPDYFVEQDSYKDSEGHGLLQRYLEALGLEIDEELITYIDNYPNVFSITDTPVELLPFLGLNIGAPPNIDGTTATFKKVLTYAVALYKIKGTPCSYSMLFNLLGLNCSIIEYPKPPLSKYDNDQKYDETTNFDVICGSCTFYDILYWDKNDDCTIPVINSVPSTVIDRMVKIICFLEPIDAKLQKLVPKINVCEDLSIGVQQQVVIEGFMAATYDTNLLYDSSTKYDDLVATTYDLYNF